VSACRAFAAWLLWLAVHLFGLTGFKNRVAVLSHSTVAFLSCGRPQPAITAQQVFGRQVSESRSAVMSSGRGAFDVPRRG
jgi:NADH:quinone reductase (non-electrogenic)